MTSTCHGIFPKPNAFGEAFRLDGYRRPAQAQDMIEEKPVSMGSDRPKTPFPARLAARSIEAGRC